MKRVQGSAGVKLLECMNPVKDKWRVRWDVQTDEENGGVNFMQEDFDHFPTVGEVRDLVWGWVNSKTDDEIREGFSWKGNAVWLSSEHQMNYMMAYQAAKASEDNLPAYFMLGTDESPVYYRFDTLSELESFVGAMALYIQSKVAAGWVEKKALDISLYTAG